ncbi:MAG TPA: putative quinol monooxygenase [Methyloceanibacter sp.]|nr:putative quinol monooxygenase [Methyloceanibacter sp.]
MAGKVTVIAYHRAKPGKERALREALLKVCAPTRGEKGCLNYDLHVSPDDPGLLVFHENWESMADLDAHLASPHIDAFRAVAPDLLAEPPNITLGTEVRD